MFPYIPNTEENIQEMLKKIGVSSIDALFSDIPDQIKLNRELNLEDRKSELEVEKDLVSLASKNKTLDELTCFLGAGAYDRYIPAVIKHLAGRSEFYTAYTPYQAEISQGTLQVIFEYQTMICELTGMDVSNASLYDGASAAAEACIMAMTQTKRKKILCSDAVHPETKQVMETYGRFRGYEVEYISLDNGITSLDEVRGKLDKEVAAVLIQNPNFFGLIEELGGLSEDIHKNKSLLIMSVDPISLGILKTPGSLGADIVVGEGQQLGNSISYGGPYLGFMACTKKLMRKMPGRIVGQSEDAKGKRAFVLTLQAREQHIRRNKATSNICSNQALNALMAAVYMITMGKKGIREVAVQTIQKANYAFERISSLEGYSPLFESRKFFSEFPVVLREDFETTEKLLLDEGIIGGYNLGKDFDQAENSMLICVTEKRTREEIDKLAEVLEVVR